MGGTNHIPRNTGVERKFVDRVELYVAKNIRQNMRVTEIAARFSISPASLQRLCHKYLQQSFRKYLEDTRMKLAMKLLRRGKSVKEAMYAVGYRYRSTFNNAFIRKYHFPPSYFKP